MTPTKEMIEAAARVLCEAWLSPIAWDYQSAGSKSMWRDSATATLTAVLPMVRAAVVEECAKVAENMFGEGPNGSYDNGATSDGFDIATRHIASAIRALSPDSEATR